MHNRMVRIVSSRFLAAVFTVISATAHAGLQEANEALAAKDYVTALKELEPLAAKGEAVAQYQLAEIYNDGTGVPMDEERAVSWYRKAAEQGHSDAQYMLGVMYDNGAGVPLDYKQAVLWYRKAAEQGNVKGQSILGSMYVDGHGVSVNFVEGLKWFTISAAEGYEIGQENARIVEAHMTQKQIKQARTLAREWKKKHAK